MGYSFRPVHEADAHELASWRYEEPYDFYNPQPGNFENDVANYLDPQMHYYAILGSAGDLIGFFCYGEDARVLGGDYKEEALDLGLGVRPDLTGKGNGAGIVRAVLDYVREVLGQQRLRVTVAAFNARARQLWEKLGFEPVSTFVTKGGRREQKFLIMVREADQAEGNLAWSSRQ